MCILSVLQIGDLNFTCLVFIYVFLDCLFEEKPTHRSYTYTPNIPVLIFLHSSNEVHVYIFKEFYNFTYYTDILINYLIVTCVTDVHVYLSQYSYFSKYMINALKRCLVL